jgi:single-stranded DNA-binding protein
MNYISVCAQLVEKPREVFISASSTAVRCNALIPPVGNKAPTPIELNFYGKNCQRAMALSNGACLYISDGTLRHDLEARTYSIHGGTFAVVNDQFPIINTVILSGRCVKDVARDDERAFKTTANGLMICNQTLTVTTGRNQADLFNFFSINQMEDKINYAELLVNFTRKGTGLTLKGRIVTDAWTDQESKERRTNTKIQLVRMTLAPKGEASKPVIEPQANVSADQPVQSLWGGRAADDIAEPYGVNTGSIAPGFAKDDNEPEPF